MRYCHLCLSLTQATAASVLSFQWAFPALRHQHQYQHHRRHQHHTPCLRAFGAMHAISNIAGGRRNGEVRSPTQLYSSELEIEKKFCIPNEQSASRLEQTLTSLGFTISHTEEFVDWYFDLPAPNWHFALNDCWFRYREKKVKVLNNWGWKGSWQVKRGSKKVGSRGNDGMTVYEEFQGEDAKKLIRDMVLQQSCLLEVVGASSETDAPTSSSTLNSNYDGHEVPYLSGAESLVPFARIETLRKCFEAANDNEFSDLKVDIDKTNFGHMVGEVEAVVDDGSNDKARVDAAKEKISRLVDLILIKSELDCSVDAIGKLEYYLINNRRDLYDACVKAGSLVN